MCFYHLHIVGNVNKCIVSYFVHIRYIEKPQFYWQIDDAARHILTAKFFQYSPRTITS